MAKTSMGRFAEPALWILVALGRGPAGAAGLIDAVRALDGPIGPGTLLGSIARLERRSLIERTSGAGHPMYRLATDPRAGSG
jgi:DNA-binding PadR family transcriptional regulator